MFTTTTPSAPTLSTTTVTPASPTSPTSPTRASRLRGLSYLRNYTQNLHTRSESDSTGRNSRPGLSRARSQPSPDQARNPEQPSSSTPSTSQAPPARRAPSPPHTNGWLPTANTTDGSTRIRQQSTTSEVASSAPAPTVTTAETTPARPMTRSRADTAGAVLTVRNQAGPRSSSADANNGDGPGSNPLPSIRFIPHYDPRANRPSLSFPAVTRTLPSVHSIIRVGRYSERENAPDVPANAPSSAPVGFKSKVVSRRHCEFWCQNSQWYVKDVKSSSGTFLNHLRLSPPGVESKAFPVNDGDVVQLGIDFRGGEEMIFRCVKIRIECNRGWQKHLNNFNKKTHKALLARTKPKKDSDTASVNSSECSICLMSIAPCQSLFVAPCSHVWHYKCIRPILNGHTWPNFLCPNCRAVADLEADVDEQDDEIWEEDEEEEEEEAANASLELSEKKSAPQAVAGATSAPPATSTRNVKVQSDGLRTPEAMQPVRDADADAATSGALEDRDGDMSPPEDLADLASAMSLADDTQINRGPSDSEDSPAEQIEEAGASSGNLPSSSSLSVPRAIPPRHGNGNTTGYDLSAGTMGGEGVMTPRNDAGPFVLDGGAGRPESTRRVHAPAQSIDAASTA